MINALRDACNMLIYLKFIFCQARIINYLANNKQDNGNNVSIYEISHRLTYTQCTCILLSAQFEYVVGGKNRTECQKTYILSSTKIQSRDKSTDRKS